MRSLSSLTVAASVLLLSVACSSKDEERAVASTAGGSESTAASISEEAVVNVYNWADYIDPGLLEKFTAETGIKVNYDTYDSNELLETKLMAASCKRGIGRERRDRKSRSGTRFRRKARSSGSTRW